MTATDTRETDAESENQTETAATRWAYTNDVLAGAVVVAHVALLASAFAFQVSVPARLWDVFALEVALATTWAFGRETLMAVRDAWKGSGGGGE
jgi:hypothetical protein